MGKAHMIPDECKYFDEKSNEKGMYNALKNHLDDDYYVFYSYNFKRIIQTEGQHDLVRDNECDFIIFNYKLGILCVEAKNGRVRCDDNGQWYYSDNNKMSYSPFEQAQNNQINLIDKIKSICAGNSVAFELYNKCKISYCVWFPSFSREELDDKKFIGGYNTTFIMSKSAFSNPEKEIETIMSYDILSSKSSDYKGVVIENKLTKDEGRKYFDLFLKPTFRVIETFDSKLNNYKLNILLNEQMICLDFLSEQKSVAISGAAGTGKTMIALEKARLLNDQKENTLFLCFNSRLKDYLQSSLSNIKAGQDNYIDVYTIDGFLMSYKNKGVNDFVNLHKEIKNEIEKGIFKYKNFIIDEAQDFGIDDIENSGIIEFLYQCSCKADGIFYLFYDKNQLVQSSKLPDLVNQLESKITLHKNCRNTKNIASSSLSVFNKKANCFDGAYTGIKPIIYFGQSKIDLMKKIDKIVEERKNDSIIKILTFSTVDKCSLSDSIDNNFYTSGDKKIEVLTIRTFKGLEADVIILIDCDKDAILNGVDFYTGSSRAKSYLYIFSPCDAKELIDICKRLPNDFPRKNNPPLDIANYIQATFKQ